MGKEDSPSDPWHEGNPPDGWIEGALVFPLGLDHPASEAGFNDALSAMSEKYGEGNVWPDMVEIEGTVYPAVNVRKPYDPIDESISKAWSRIFFSD